MEKKGIKNFFYRMLCGAFLGISVIAPGISGSMGLGMNEIRESSKRAIGADILFRD